LKLHNDQFIKSSEEFSINRTKWILSFSIWALLKHPLSKPYNNTGVEKDATRDKDTSMGAVVPI